MDREHSMEDEIIIEARRIEQDSNHSARGHFMAASFWTTLHIWVGGATAVVAAVAGTSALAQFDHHNVIAGILAIIVAAVTGIMTFLNPNEKAALHRNAGNDYTALRNNTRIFRNIGRSQNLSEHDLHKRLKDLSDRRHDLNNNNPQIPGWAYRKGKKGIEAGESDYQVDVLSRHGEDA